MTEKQVEQPLSYYASAWKLRNHLIQDHGYPEDKPELLTYSLMERDHAFEHDNDGRFTAPGHRHV